MPHLVITGASAGIGAATAELFQNNGFDIVNLSRKQCPVAGVTNIPCDLAQPDFIQKIQNDLLNALGDSAQIDLRGACGRRSETGWHHNQSRCAF